MKAKKESSDTSRYTQFLRSLDLAWISMVETNFSADRKEYFDVRVPEIRLNWTCKPVQVAEDNFEVRANIILRLSKPKASTPFFDLSAGFLLHLHSDKAVIARDVDRFAESEVRLILWPYFREYVSSVCGRMHVPPIFLPLTGTSM